MTFTKGEDSLLPSSRGTCEVEQCMMSNIIYQTRGARVECVSGNPLLLRGDEWEGLIKLNKSFYEP